MKKEETIQLACQLAFEYPDCNSEHMEATMDTYDEKIMTCDTGGDGED